MTQNDGNYKRKLNNGMLRLGLATLVMRTEAKAKLLGIPYIDLSSTSFSPEALAFVPRAVAERFFVIPFMYDDKEKVLSLAMSNPVDLEALSFVKQKTNLIVKSFAASPTAVEKAINQQYRQQIVGEVGEAVKETEAFDKTRTVDSEDIAQIIKEAPVAKIVATILEYAVNSRSSDVHIEPQEDRVRVRYRIDGILYDRLSLPKSVQEAVISRIKILAEMKIDEHRIPQDGRFNFRVGDKEVDLRISVLPTSFGEKIVMRLLRKSGGVPTLQDLGLSGPSLKNLETAMLRPHGIITVVGPTGSGKTTTLYSVLNKLNTTRVNIMTLEDPVEYQMPGVNQVQINPAVGLTFATGLRSFLRQDPNIILVGEIRDKETTELAIQASLTGHLVFSTLHTSNAAGALPRLIDLGAERFLLASTMTAILGQRIVRTICPHCKISYVPVAQIITEMKAVLGNLFPVSSTAIKLYKGKGCAECGDSGYIGRIGIFETLPVSDKIVSLVLSSADSSTIERQAVSEGMITMKQDGYLKVLQGLSTVEEVLRVAQE
jgi:type II secretory ATPase GspE/PulE/Tfp pilus assembly ATPase PilB-like protein